MSIPSLCGAMSLMWLEFWPNSHIGLTWVPYAFFQTGDDYLRKIRVLSPLPSRNEVNIVSLACEHGEPHTTPNMTLIVYYSFTHMLAKLINSIIFLTN